MILYVKHKYFYYKRFEYDIWGLSYIDTRIKYPECIKSWLFRFFFKLYSIRDDKKFYKLRRYIYRIDIIDIPKRIKR